MIAGHVWHLLVKAVKYKYKRTESWSYGNQTYLYFNPLYLYVFSRLTAVNGLVWKHGAGPCCTFPSSSLTQQEWIIWMTSISSCINYITVCPNILLTLLNWKILCSHAVVVQYFGHFHHNYSPSTRNYIRCTGLYLTNCWFFWPQFILSGFIFIFCLVSFCWFVYKYSMRRSLSKMT